MLESNIDSFFKKLDKPRFCQGDILRDVKVSIDVPVEWQQQESSIVDFDLPYCVVMTQECDLDWDYKTRNDKEAKNNDKFLPTILVCPAYQDNFFYEGIHLKDWKMEEHKGKKKIKKIMANDQNNRLHYLNGDTKLQIPNLVIDFKHFYTLPTIILSEQYDRVYLATVNELFRERLSQRFTNYLSRIGLPVLKNENLCEYED